MVKRNKEKLGRFSYETEIRTFNKNVAEKLVAELNLDVRQARFHVDGTFYNLVEEFPAVLFDLYGYSIIHSDDVYDTKMLFTEKINTHAGIHTLSDYVKYQSTPKAFDGYEKLLQETKEKNAREKVENMEKFKKSSLHAIMQKAIKNAGTSNLLPA